MSKDPLIIDSDYERPLTELGFCMIPLLSNGQILEIGSVYDQFAIENNISGLTASHSITTPEDSLRISNSIRDIIMPSLTTTFRNFEFFISGFMVKEGNTEKELPLHQDWNIIDESRYTSYQIWIPLELSYPSNGGMYVLPGSHHFYQNIRSGTYGMPMVETDEALRPLIADMIIPSGDVLVYHNSLFHASYPNKSKNNRVSAIVGIYQKDATLEYYEKNTEQNRTDIYAINPSIFLTSLSSLEKGGEPLQPLSKKESELNPIDNSAITAADLREKFNEHFGNDGREFEPIQLHLLKEGELEKKMFRDGYIILDFLDDKTVADLKAEYIKLFTASQTSIGRFTPMEHTTPETKRYIHNFIIDKARPFLEQYFNDYMTPIASFFTKYANSEGDLTWHNDTSLLLNTHLEPHYGIWCPLRDVDEKNGALCVIEGSHKFSHVMFVNGIEWPYMKYMPQFVKKKKILQLKAGQMVLFDLRLIHDAVPNRSNEDRICFCVRLTNKKSKYFSFISEKGNSEAVSIYEESFDYYLRDEWTDDNKLRNKMSKVGEVQNAYSKINYSAIEARLAS